MEFFSHSGYRTLEDRCFFLFSGPDAERYLNGQVTNDVSTATPQSSIYAFITNAKGKLQGELFIHRLDEQSFLCDGPSEIRKNLFARLDQYLIADDLELKDVSDEWYLKHYSLKPEHLIENPAVIIRQTNRYGLLAYDVLSQNDFSEDTIKLFQRNEIESLRIETKTPVWGKELRANMLPQEASIDDKAISFEKGCYVGQEIISRIKSIGRVNKKLVSISLPKPLPETASLYLYSREDHSPAGEITSVSPIPKENGSIKALAYINRKAIHDDAFHAGNIDLGLIARILS